MGKIINSVLNAGRRLLPQLDDAVAPVVAPVVNTPPVVAVAAPPVLLPYGPRATVADLIAAGICNGMADADIEARLSQVMPPCYAPDSH